MTTGTSYVVPHLRQLHRRAGSRRAILDYLQRVDAVRGRFHGDDAGWFHADLVSGDVTLLLDRYTADEEGIRAELNSWAAAVEAGCRRAGAGCGFMERIIQTRQLFTLQGPAGGRGELLCLALCEYLARATDGVYQADGEGFFTSDGCPLVPDP